MDSDIIGENLFPVKMLCEKMGFKNWVPIKYEGKKAGEIYFEAKYKAEKHSHHSKKHN